MLRDKPYVWVTWLKGLMAGDDQCEWQTWYKIHHQDYTKRPSDFDSVEWNLNHTRLLRHARYKWGASWHTTLEKQNSFKVELGQANAIVSGKPDLIARSGDGRLGLIIDAKTGKPRTSDRVQVLLYMYLYPWGTDDPAKFEGVLQYTAREEKIPASMLTEEFKETFHFWMDILLSETAPEAIPSEDECDWCDIMDCPLRIEKRG